MFGSNEKRIMKDKSLMHNLIIVFYLIMLGSVLWVGISSVIQRFKCPAMTETQLFLHIPKSFICEWEYCK